MDQKNGIIGLPFGKKSGNLKRICSRMSSRSNSVKVPRRAFFRAFYNLIYGLLDEYWGTPYTIKNYFHFSPSIGITEIAYVFLMVFLHLYCS
jgi:hypothetical protein